MDRYALKLTVRHDKMYFFYQCTCYLLLLTRIYKQIRERTEGCSKCIVRKKTCSRKGLVSTSRTFASPIWDGTRCAEACHIRCRCFKETNICWNVGFSKNIRSGHNITTCIMSNWDTMSLVSTSRTNASPKRTGLGVRRSASLRPYNTRRKHSTETYQTSVKGQVR